jgi:hypothetical protein
MTDAHIAARFLALHRVPHWLRPALRGMPPLDGLKRIVTAPDAVTLATLHTMTRHLSLEERIIVAQDAIVQQEGMQAMIGFKHFCLVNTEAALRDAALGPNDVLAVVSYLSLDGAEVPSHDVYVPAALWSAAQHLAPDSTTVNELARLMVAGDSSDPVAARVEMPGPQAAFTVDAPTEPRTAGDDAEASPEPPVSSPSPPAVVGAEDAPQTLFRQRGLQVCQLHGTLSPVLLQALATQRARAPSVEGHGLVTLSSSGGRVVVNGVYRVDPDSYELRGATAAYDVLQQQGSFLRARTPSRGRVRFYARERQRFHMKR